MLQVQSALFGMSGFRPTPGQIPTGGFVHVTGSSGSIGWLVKDAALHTQIAELFKLPGAARWAIERTPWDDPLAFGVLWGRMAAMPPFGLQALWGASATQS